MKFVLENYGILVYMYYTHPNYHTYIFGKNCAYYIQICTVVIIAIINIITRNCMLSQQM